MNRSWFRNPFSANNSRAIEDEQSVADAGDVLGGDSSTGSQGKRRRRRGKATAHSDTSYTNTSTTYSESTADASGASNLSAQNNQQYITESHNNPGTSHTHAPSLHSISSIRTTHFLMKDQSTRFTNSSTSPIGTSTEVSPSKTPLSARDRMSWASTASGMIGFNDEDRLEAERRFAEIEELDEEQEEQEEQEQDAHLLYDRDADLASDQPGSSQHQNIAGDDSFDNYGIRKSVGVPSSRSSTSLKSILKKSTASAESLEVKVILQTPGSQAARTVTFSPNTLPGAASPPVTNVTPEHPRSLAEQQYLLQQQEAQRLSPPRHSYVSDDSLLESDESREIEEALLSRSATNSSASPNESSDSLRLHGSASKRGTGFLDNMNNCIPSPESSFTQTKHHPAVSMESSNILDMSAPSQVQDATIGDDRSKLRASFAAPRPFLLRQSVIEEESSANLSSSLNNSTNRTFSSPASPQQEFHSFATAPSPSTAILTPLRTSLHSRKALIRHNGSPDKDSTGILSGSRALAGGRRNSVDEFGKLQEVPEDEGVSVFLTPSQQNTSIVQEDVSYLSGLAKQNDQRTDSAETIEEIGSDDIAQSVPVVTPSGSSSSLVAHLQDSPFSKLISSLLTAQDDLLSHRADQKTLLLSLITNLRGELASRDRLMDSLEAQKVAAEQNALTLKATSEAQNRQLIKALEEAEQTKQRLAAEIAKRDETFQAELWDERSRRRDAEQMLNGNADNSASKSNETPAVSSSSNLKEENAALRDRIAELETNALMAGDTYSSQESVASLSQRCRLLDEQLATAEMQISRLSAKSDARVVDLQKRLNAQLEKNEELQRQYQRTKSTLESERVEQARQYDISASIHEDLRQQKDGLLRSVTDLQRDKDITTREMLALKKDSTMLLQQREERITQLEGEILRRSTERRQVANNGCPDCQDHLQRTAFLEGEVVRLRELVGKMRMESADRDVKVAKLVKAKEQLQEDVQGLNIALEAKQQEVMLLKREVHRQSSDTLSSSKRLSRPNSQHLISVKGRAPLQPSLNTNAKALEAASLVPDKENLPLRSTHILKSAPLLA